MEGARELAIDQKSKIANLKSRAAGVRLRRALMLLTVVLVVSTLVALWVGYQRLDLLALRTDERARLIFFELRLPRVLMAGVVGASLGVVGAALQAMFRNPLAEPLTLGVSGGGALGASVAIAFGMGSRVAGLPVVFVAAFLGACASVVVVYRLARTGATVLPGALLLAGVVVNTVAAAGVVARTALGAGEMPVGAITAIAGGPVFLWLLRRQQRYTAM